MSRIFSATVPSSATMDSCRPSAARNRECLPEAPVSSANAAKHLAPERIDTIVEVGQALEPHRLCGYLFRLAQSFTAFFEKCPVLTAPEPTRSNRLALCLLVAQTMRTGLGLLGIESPDRL